MSKHILIADDDTLFVDILTLGFQKHAAEFTVTTVDNGKNTLTMLSEHKPDLLILDIRMPYLDGYGVLEHMQANQTSVPVIVMSYFQDEVHKKKAKELGVKAYLVKSEWKIEQLVSEIKKHLGM